MIDIYAKKLNISCYFENVSIQEKKKQTSKLAKNYV